MGALPRPNVPDGPIRTLSDSLHELHHQAGWPSLREIAKEVGCSHTTVSVAFSDPRVPRWGLLELIVETLDGDTDRFHQLWLAASQSETQSGSTRESDQGSQVRSPLPPRQLPADVVGFTGRADQLDELDRLLEDAGTSAPTMAISAVSGTAGVGKTALAVRWAHRVAYRFPDGQLYVNLRGYDPGTPVQPTDALAAFLRDLGLDSSAIPYALAERSARYRTLLSGRRMLVLLDNARSVDQIRDLLPGTSSCFVLVTSRDTLPALVARHGAVRINLDLLSAGEAGELLRALIGPRADAEPEQVAALAERCARLPLALRIAAELSVLRSTTTLADLMGELRDERRRLDLLAAGDDDYTAIRAVFSWSYRQLSSAAAQAFQLLGVHPGRDIDVYAIAALVGIDVTAAHRVLEQLSRTHLVEEAHHGRFGMHDLLRAYAAERASDCSDADRQSALNRLFDYYLYATTIAADLAFPSNRQRRVRVAAPPVPTPGLTGAPDARTWLDREWPNLLAAADAIATPHTSQLAVALAPYLEARAHFQHALTLHGLALNTARTHRDRVGEGNALGHIGTVLRRLGRYEEARDHYQQALVIHREVGNRAAAGTVLNGFGIIDWRLGQYRSALEHLNEALEIHREIGDHAGVGGALNGLGIAYRRLGRYQQALDKYHEALAIYREIGDRAGEAGTLGNLGVVYLHLGRYDEALNHHQLSLAIDREIGDRTGIGVSLTNVGIVHSRLGRHGEAVDCHQQALEICRKVGYRATEGDALRGLGIAYGHLGRPDEALVHLQQAVTIGREIGEADLETAALNDLGGAFHATAQPDRAMTCYQSALALATQTDDGREQARALDGIARLHCESGDLSDARQHWKRALGIYTDIGVPEAQAVRHELAALDEGSDH